MTKIRKIGNSSGVIIASGLLKNANLKLGDDVEIVCENGKIVITKAKEE